MEQRGLVIVGGGPAGYVAALRAAQLGGKATIIEEQELGGTCVSKGCIPTKTLLHSAEIYHSISKASESGIIVRDASLNLSILQKHKNSVISNMITRLNNHIERKRIEVIKGRARLLPQKRLQVSVDKGQTETIQAENIIIATGAIPIRLSVPGADGPNVMSTNDLLQMKTVPQRTVIIGGGVIGLEMATFLSRVGCKVTVIEFMAHCLSGQDREVVTVLEDSLRKEGIDIYCGASVSEIKDSPEGKSIVFKTGNEEKVIEAAAVAVCIGYKPNIDNLGLEECGIETGNGTIKVNEKMETSVPGVYAAGDITGGIMLAHAGYAEGRVAAQNAMGIDCCMDAAVVPQCIFTSPEVASAGLTEEEAAGSGYQTVIGRFPFAANGMAQIMGETRGLVKIVADEQYKQILGVHIVGPSASSLIHEAALAIKLEATAYDLQQTIHAHPTLAEALWEASLDVTGETLHY